MRSSQEIKDDAKSKYSLPAKEFLILEVLLDIRELGEECAKCPNKSAPNAGES